jgi:hypothetical protein
MSGSFMDMDVPPTRLLRRYTGNTSDAVSPEFKAAGRRVVLLPPNTMKPPAYRRIPPAPLR